MQRKRQQRHDPITSCFHGWDSVVFFCYRIYLLRPWVGKFLGGPGTFKSTYVDDPFFPCYNLTTSFCSPMQTTRSLLYSMLPPANTKPLLPAIGCNSTYKNDLPSLPKLAESTPLSLAPLSEQPLHQHPSFGNFCTQLGRQPPIIPPLVYTLPPSTHIQAARHPPLPDWSHIALTSLPSPLTTCALIPHTIHDIQPSLTAKTRGLHPQHSEDKTSEESQHMLQLLPPATFDLNGPPTEAEPKVGARVYVRRSSCINKAYNSPCVGVIDRASRRAAALDPYTTSSSSSGARAKHLKRTRKIEDLLHFPIKSKVPPLSKKKLKEIASLCGVADPTCTKEAVSPTPNA